MKKAVFAACLGLTLAGCATSSGGLNSIDGVYYWTGDAKCMQILRAKGGIACHTKNRQFTEYRRPLSAQEVQMVQFNIMRRQAEEAAGAQMLMQSNANLAASVRYPTFAPPVVGPYQSYNTNQVRCIGVGIYTNCRY